MAPSDSNSGRLPPPPPPLPLPGISRAFFNILRPGDRALVYPRAFGGPVIFTSQYCRFVSMISSPAKTINSWLSTSEEDILDKDEMVDPENERSLPQYWEIGIHIRYLCPIRTKA